MPPPLRVVAHNGSRVYGGGEIGTARVLAGLQARGHRVKMLCRDARIAARVAEEGIPAGVAHVGGLAALHDVARLALALRRERPHAVVLTTFKKVPNTALAARLAGVRRVVQRVVLSTDAPRRWPHRLALRRGVDLVTLNAAAMRPAFLAADPGLDPARVVVVPDGVRAPARAAAPGALRRALGIPPEAPVVGAVARLSRQKRFDRLLEALARLPGDVHCVLAGEGDAAGLRARAAALGMAERLHLLGFRADVGDVLDALDVYVVSSDVEGMANAMLEAMAFGLPVVSTDVSGAREALEAGPGRPAAGVVVERAVEPLAGALAALLADPALRRRLGESARARARDDYGFEALLDRWEALLRPA